MDGIWNTRVLSSLPGSPTANEGNTVSENEIQKHEEHRCNRKERKSTMYDKNNINKKHLNITLKNDKKMQYIIYTCSMRAVKD